MSLPVSPGKVLRLFLPLWLLLALSLWLQWEAWRDDVFLFAAIASLPLIAAGAAALMRGRWRLELTPDALIHHTLGRTERFEWARMGPIGLRAPPVGLFMLPTFWFDYPLDEPRTVEERASKHMGRRILCVFGDHSAAETIQRIEAYRALHAPR